MITVIKTGDREGDLLLLKAETAKIKDKKLLRIDCREESEKETALGNLEMISFLPQQQVYILHFLELNEPTCKKLLSASDDIIVVSPAGRSKPELLKGAKLLTTPTTDQQLKNKINSLLATHKIALSRDELLKLLQTLTVADEQGKEKVSPLLCAIFERRLTAIASTDQEETNKAFKNLLNVTTNQVNQWDILANLFNPHKDRQHAYFAALSELLTPYEVISFSKNTLFMALAITTGKAEHLDNTSIATKLGKHPFYISSLAKTIDEKAITGEKIYKVLTRLMNLELALKSGKFDDEQFGLDILFATM